MAPVNMSHEDLLAVLDDIRSRVAQGDSFEGHIEWLLPEDDDAPARSFDVQASYRVGNTMGQGGMRMIGEWREILPEGEPGGAGERVPSEGDITECGYCTTRITFRLGEWMDDNFGSACTDPSAPWVPHKPKEAGE